MTVAIDGPAGAGKSAVARGAARALGFVHIDTGALYRSVALAVLRAGAPTGDGAAVAACLPGIALDVRFAEGAQHVSVNGEDVTGAIRTPEVSMATSDVSAHPCVRAFLLELQRGLARERDCILDGRDIGTVVLPQAEVKIFLTATPGERARRRWLELRAKGMEESYEKVLAEVLARDEQDSSRGAAPLKQAWDALLLDSTGMNEAQTAQAVIEIIQKRRDHEQNT
jgi:cytidylate kinase